MSNYKALKEFIKKERAKSKENQKFFGNYTQLSTNSLQRLVDKYNKKQDKPSTCTKSVPKEAKNEDLSRAKQLLEECLSILNNSVENDEAKRLHNMAMSIEFELNNI